MTTLGWTSADQAELELLVWELVNGYFDHRDNCEACRRNYCPVVPRTIALAVDWRDTRALISRAAHLRRLQDTTDGVAA